MTQTCIQAGRHLPSKLQCDAAKAGLTEATVQHAGQTSGSYS